MKLSREPAVILKVAIATPLDTLFDYLAPGNGIEPQPGQRVRVPFGRREQIGIVVALSDQSQVASQRLRTVHEILDDEPLLDSATIQLLEWAAAYYQHPPGEVFSAALPAALRRGIAAKKEPQLFWKTTDSGQAADIDALAKKAAAQARVLAAIKLGDGLDEAGLRAVHKSWRKMVSALEDKGLVIALTATNDALARRPVAVDSPPTLTVAQQNAIAGMPTSGFNPCLLEGVTGSGKTEVYLQLIAAQLEQHRQSLVLVPEIGLTPQLVARFRRRIAGRVCVMHSGLTDSQRLTAWVEARDGIADVIIGTRSAIFAPLARPGLIVVDEEHDASYKQQDGFRYSARDIAVYRARQLNIPVVLGTATPAFETLQNALEKRYLHLLLPERPGNARQPEMKIIDLRVHPMRDGLSQPMIAAMRTHLEAGGQTLVYLNRRGFAPTLLCPSCGETQECRRCDARMVLHQRQNRLICHHCGSERPAIQSCPECHEEMVPVGQGTERLEQALTELFPGYPLVRIDRDSTRRAGELERRLQSIRDKEARILLGTQMLTKGHDFADVSFVGIVDPDQGLFGTDFRSSERLAQTILQVAGRAGRAERPGEVWIQTHYPDHPLLQTLLRAGYDRFAEQALAERRDAVWPPFSYLALLRAECVSREQLFEFLDWSRASALPLITDGLRLLGPASSPMERRAGRYRGQLLVQSNHRGQLQTFLAGWKKQLTEQKSGRRVRWSIDVDPVELF